MQGSLVAPEDFRDWVPGDQILRGNEQVMAGAAIYGYRYGAGEEAIVPPLRDYLIVAHRQRSALMHRMVDGRWRTDRLTRGDISFFARGEESHWRWDDPLDVLHLHLPHEHLIETSRAMFDRDVEEVDLQNAMRSQDPALHRVVSALAEENLATRAGSGLVVESLLTQLGVLLLRRHTRVLVRQERGGALNLLQQRVVREYVAAHLHERISLEDLAGSVHLSRYHFLRLFREAMDVTPHEYVTRQRVERAARLLSRTVAPIHEIAVECGFADQSHLTRCFRKRMGVTPGQFRGRR